MAIKLVIANILFPDHKSWSHLNCKTIFILLINYSYLVPPKEEASLFTGVGGADQHGAAENEEEHPDDIPEIDNYYKI